MKLKPTLLVLAVTSLMAGCDNNNTNNSSHNNVDNPPAAVDAKTVESSNSKTPEQAAMDLKQLFSTNFEQSLSFNPIQEPQSVMHVVMTSYPTFFQKNSEKSLTILRLNG